MSFIRHLRGFAREELRKASKKIRYNRAYKKYRDATMIPRRNFRANLELTERTLAIPGIVVECGVWRGGMIAAISDTLGPDRSYYLFDSFEGLPPAKPIDGHSALAWQKAVDKKDYCNNFKASIEEARSTMQRSKARQVEYIPGWFDKTLPGFQPQEPIALLRLDADWYESTMCCLDNLYPKVVSGGLILIDDYFVWEGCTRAVHDYLSRHQLTARLHEFGGVAYIIKP